MSRLVRNRRGQGLVEYLILVALMAVAAIGIVRAMQQTMNAQFANVVLALQGKKQRVQKDNVDESLHSKKDLQNFMNGAASRGSGQ